MRQREIRCPSCEAAIGESTVVARSAGAMIIVGLALTGCPAADDSSETMADGSATAPTVSSTMDDTGTSSATEGDDESTTAPETTALYGGVATTGDDATGTSTSGGSETGTESGTATDTDSDTDSNGSTSGPGPLYGVAET